MKTIEVNIFTLFFLTSLLLSQSVQATNYYGYYPLGLSKLFTLQSPEDASPTEPRLIYRAKSRIRRRANEICMTTVTRNLEPGAYTNWWVAFNQPKKCNGVGAIANASCALSDVANPETEASVFWSTAGVVGPKGRALFNSCEVIGETKLPPIVGNGLTTRNAEILLVIKWHGAMRFDGPALGEQLTTLNGGCEPFAATDFEGIARCRDVQIAVHPARR